TVVALSTEIRAESDVVERVTYEGQSGIPPDGFQSTARGCRCQFTNRPVPAPSTPSVVDGVRRGDHDHRGQPLLHVVRRCEKVIRHGSSWTLGRFDGVHQSL